jgi:hypothetical protein
MVASRTWEYTFSIACWRLNVTVQSFCIRYTVISVPTKPNFQRKILPTVNLAETWSNEAYIFKPGSPFACLSVTQYQWLNRLYDFNEIRCRRSLHKLPSRQDFRENRLSDSRTLFEGVKKFLHVISIPHNRFGWNSTQKISTKWRWVLVIMVKISAVNVVFYVQTRMNFCPCFKILSLDLGEIWHNRSGHDSSFDVRYALLFLRVSMKLHLLVFRGTV